MRCWRCLPTTSDPIVTNSQHRGTMDGMTTVTPTGYRRLTNQEVGARIGLTHSGASRLRSGARVASIATLQQIHKEFKIPLDELLATAERAQQGEIQPWIDMLNAVFVTIEEPKVEAGR